MCSLALHVLICQMMTTPNSPDPGLPMPGGLTHLSPGIRTAAGCGLCGQGATPSYLLASWVLRAGGSSIQPPARELPCGGHGTCTDITLRVSQELHGELRYL